MDKADEVYVPEIVVEDKSVSFVESMNKEHVIEFFRRIFLVKR